MLKVFVCLLMGIFVFDLMAAESDKDYNSAANWGGTGLLEIPTARVLDYGKYRVGATDVNPYRYYFGALAPLKNLELQGTITEIKGTKAVGDSYWAGYGNYKDKAAGIKYQLIEESKWLPAVSLGIYDPHGTRLYASQYVVASKQIYPFDFTVGFGNGRFGKKPLESISEESGGSTVKIEMFTSPKEWLSDSQFFYGIQFALNEKFSAMAEYAPIKYEKLKEPAVKYYKNGVKSHYNYAVKYSPFKWLDIKGSFQRGEEVGIQLAVKFDIGEPMIPIYHKPYVEPENVKSLSLEERIIRALTEVGFIDISLDISKYALWIELENNRYFYTDDAIKMLMNTLDEILPESIEYYNVTFTNNRIPMLSFEIERGFYKDYLDEKISKEELYSMMNFNTDLLKVRYGHKTAMNNLIYGIKPSFGTYLNDPSGFFKYRLGLRGWLGYKVFEGGTILGSLETFPINNISTINKPLSIPVRSDISDYRDNKVWLGSLMYDKIDKFPGNIFTRYSFGYLETEYAGLDMEVARPFMNGKIFVGLNSSITKKRDSENYFRIKKDAEKEYYRTLFFNTRFNFPSNEIYVDLQNGYFLAGDKGTKITVSKVIRGVVLSAWYSYTKTDVFKDNVNRNYHDKGISVSIPLRIFKGADSKTAYSFSLSPWTRDVAQDIAHHNPLFDYIGKETKIILDNK